LRGEEESGDAQLAMGPENLRSVGAIPNPIAVDSWPFQRSDDGYLLWIGRMTPEKGPHRAIEIARVAGSSAVFVLSRGDRTGPTPRRSSA
jgi:glycosyltransferase involved in cell wall biosynthesis